MAQFGFVADDLTGASDVLAQAQRYGLDAVLVLGDAPFPTDADVVGIAGPARSLGGDAFDTQVRDDLSRIAALDLEVLVYKVCSTFDSAPELGSIGRGVELLHEKFPQHGSIPVAPAQPGFGRYTAFSHHFASHAGTIYRLDRHPVMSRHPSTPMAEADLRAILEEQLSAGADLGAIHLPAYSDNSFTAQWDDLYGRSDTTAFVVDAVDDEHLDAVAGALRRSAEAHNTSLVVGSGGIMAALAKSTSQRQPAVGDDVAARGPVLTVSASASSVTAGQLAEAIGNGWADVPVPPSLLHGEDPDALAALTEHVATDLAAGRDVVVHTTLGADDPRYSSSRPVHAQHVGALIGTLAGQMATRGLTHDIAVFGGDTSSHALIAMGVKYLRVSQQFVTAGPICRTDDDAAVAGCRLLLKGGQVGPVDILRRYAGQLPV